MPFPFEDRIASRDRCMQKEMKQRLLLAVLYLSFISLGLPDTVLGTVWPEMRHAFGKTLDYAGVLIAMTTIISAITSFGSGYVTQRLSTWAILTACGFMTAAAMFGYAFSPAWAMLLFFTVFFGIGQGAVDTAVNSTMSRHYSSRHMNWVHCCWGIGATGGPFIISTVFAMDASWRVGYGVIGTIQAVLAVIFLLSRRLWDAAPSEEAPGPENPALPQEADGSLTPAAQRLASVSGMLFYFLYSGVEIVVGLWGASWLIGRYHITPASAAMIITLYWGALTAGRFLVGFFAERFTNRSLIRGGIAIAFCSAALLALDPGCMISEMALVLIGLGVAPLYPTMMHDTPRRVGLAASDRQTGFQVGSALAGATLIPPMVGVIAQHRGLTVFAPALLFFCLLVLAAHEVSLRFSLLSGAAGRQKQPHP